jgi:epoxide hydrolase-like predicted phosphatase
MESGDEMEQKIQAVIWDMGGVILRGGDPTSREMLAQRLKIERSKLEELVFESETSQLALLGKITEDAHWEQVGSILGLSGETLRQARREFWGGNHMDEELVQFIGSLRPRYKTGLLSNAWTGSRQSIGSKFAFLHVFDVSVFSDEVGMAKPDPAFYRWILERLEVLPQEAVFIDDMQGNIAAARALGIAAIQFTSRSQAMHELGGLLPDLQVSKEG